MMEFFSSRSIRSTRKLHRCELCEHDIEIGSQCVQESGKYDNEFFSRYLHFICAEIEAAYCQEVDCEFCWEDVIQYALDEVCAECPHDYHNEDADGWIECSYSNKFACPRMNTRFNPESGA